MTRYILTKRVFNTLKGRGYQLVCKICQCPLHVNDCVESKPSKYRKRKFYHCKCYEESFIDVDNNEESKPE